MLRICISCDSGYFKLILKQQVKPKNYADFLKLYVVVFYLLVKIVELSLFILGVAAVSCQVYAGWSGLSDQCMQCDHIGKCW